MMMSESRSLSLCLASFHWPIRFLRALKDATQLPNSDRPIFGRRCSNGATRLDELT